MDLFIFYKITNDKIVQAILEKNNTELLRGIVNFAETEGVTADSLREYIATLLANDENVLSILKSSTLHRGTIPAIMTATPNQYAV